MQQKTALIRALKQKYDATRVNISNDGLIYISGNYPRTSIGHIDDVWTCEHGCHSTRVYIRHMFIGTVYGTITL